MQAIEGFYNHLRRATLIVASLLSEASLFSLHLNITLPIAILSHDLYGGYTIEDATRLSLIEDIDVHSVFVASLPSPPHPIVPHNDILNFLLDDMHNHLLTLVLSCSLVPLNWKPFC
ncbi:hypothetical protein VNO78_16523 [Psophocarpus tetragonolobus]|uniref:Uncharacterized protein n=1 Tax=Psophocarpus tetragonolobus TaxID=3891 RepID=A0AAN9SHA2_PSOTE